MKLFWIDNRDDIYIGDSIQHILTVLFHEEDRDRILNGELFEEYYGDKTFDTSDYDGMPRKVS